MENRSVLIAEPETGNTNFNVCPTMPDGHSVQRAASEEHACSPGKLVPLNFCPFNFSSKSRVQFRLGSGQKEGKNDGDPTVQPRAKSQSKRPLARYKTHFPLIPIMQGAVAARANISHGAEGIDRGRLTKSPNRRERRRKAKKVVQFTQGRASLFPQGRRRRHDIN